MHGTPNNPNGPYSPYGPPPAAPPPGPPMPGRRPPKARQGDPRRGWIVAGAVLVLIVLGGLAAAMGPDDGGDGQPAAATAPAVPPYKVVKTFGKGLSTDITVEVDSVEGLRAVFDDVRKKHQEDGGYFVIVNCSTGGTKARDQRLANGRYAIGKEGEATTGLDDGGSEFEVLPDAQCPAG